MLARNVTQADLEQALDRVNRIYGSNIRFRDIYRQGTGYRFTLTVHKSRGPGGRRSASYFGRGRAVCAACWHVHGDFFDALLAIQPKAVVRAQNRKIDRNGGNWQDWNIGPPIAPVYFSEACACGGNEL